MTQVWYEKRLALEMEGKCYEHIWMTFSGASYMVTKDYYMVEHGKVFLINDGTKQRTGDSLENTKNECQCIGEYKPHKPYKRKTMHYTATAIKQLLNLQ